MDAAVATLSPACRAGETLTLGVKISRKGRAMKNRNAPLYAVAAAVLVVGLAFAGVPVTTLLIGLAVMVCPLAMLFMMSMHSGDQNSSDHKTDRLHDRDDHRPKAGKP
jgi:Flp pilus assembly protein TadB